MTSLLPPETLQDRYEIELPASGSPWRKGGWTHVYKGVDLVTKQDIVLRVCARPTCQEALARWRLEHQSQLACQHPCVLPVLSLGSFSSEGVDVHWSVFRRLPRTLAEAIGDTDPTQRWRFLLRWLPLVADCIDYLGEVMQIVHRDVKPANILLNDEDYPFLADFGLAYAEGTDYLTESGYVGTPGYLAPELLDRKILEQRRDGSLRRLDQWCLAAATYECLAGKRLFHPFLDDSAQLRLAREGYTDDQASELDEAAGASLPQGVHDVLRRALEPHPIRRYESCVEFARSLCSLVPRAAAPGGGGDGGDRQFIRLPSLPSCLLEALDHARQGGEPVAAAFHSLTALAETRLSLRISGDSERLRIEANPPLVADGRPTALELARGDQTPAVVFAPKRYGRDPMFNIRASWNEGVEVSVTPKGGGDQPELVFVLVDEHAKTKTR